MRMMNDNLKKIIKVILLLLSLLFFILGLLNPILGTREHVFGITLDYQNVTLFDSIKYFFNHRAYVLAFIIFTFTFLFPLIKYFDIYNRIFKIIKPSKKLSIFLMYLDKWSMLDVFMVALLLMNYKLASHLVVMTLKSGTTFLAVSILLRMILVSYMHYDEHKKQKM